MRYRTSLYFFRAYNVDGLIFSSLAALRTFPPAASTEAGGGAPAKPQTTQKTDGDAIKGKAARQPEQETDCKKYFPQTGQTISVPCEKKR